MLHPNPGELEPVSREEFDMYRILTEKQVRRLRTERDKVLEMLQAERWKNSEMRLTRFEEGQMGDDATAEGESTTIITDTLPRKTVGEPISSISEPVDRNFLYHN